MTATLTEPVRLALKAGWTVDNPGGAPAIVHCPNGAEVAVYRGSKQAIENALARLRRHGLDEALHAAEANRERTTTRVVAQADGERAERDALAREKANRERAEAAALKRATAGSGYFIEPQEVLLAEIMAPHPAPRPYRVLITPDMARAMLTVNTRNRKPRAGDISLYGSAMKSDAWQLTHQPIAFDVNGVLIDGQQRLFAIVESGTAADLFVFCGMPPESFEVVDTMRKRTAADTLHTRGEVDVNRLAAVARLVWVFDTDPQGTWRDRVSNHIIAKTVEANPEIKEAISRARPIAKATRGNLTAMSAGVFLLQRAMSPTHPKVVAFLEGVETGANMDVNDPRLRLARTTLQAVDRKVTRNSQRQLALWLKGWRAFALGRKLDVLVWRKDEKMPSVLVIQPDES